MTSQQATPEFTTSSLKEDTTLSELIHRIGHDIGNPLTSLISLSSLLERSQKEAAFVLSAEDIGRYSGTILADAWKIQGIVEKLVLILSERGKESQITDIRTLTQDAIRKTLRKSQFRAFDVEFSSSEGEMMSRVDQSQTEWLFCELLCNGLNSGGKEDSVVKVRLERAGQTISFTVENEFEHELPEELSSLFEPFVKFPLSSKGAGLGLTAASSVLERMGAKLTIAVDGQTFRATAIFQAE